MTKYNKAIAAFITSVLGLGVAFGYLDEANSQMLAGALTSVANVVLVYTIPNVESTNA